MKLITELLENTTEFVIEESAEGKKARYITGIFAQAETPNRNKRTYPKKLMEREITKFQSMIEGKKSMGELNHPNHPQVNPERASHIITELRFEGNDVYGKAKIIPTPVGNIVATLLDEGVQLGVSTRGMGSLRKLNSGINEVMDDYDLRTIDIVSDPSGIDCWVDGIMEGSDWVYENGMWMVAEESKKIIQKTNSKELTEVKLKLFEHFLKTIK